MAVFHAYALATAGWLGLQALPLLVTPKLIVAMLSVQSQLPSAVEIYFCRAGALSLVALAVLALLLTGTIPLSSSVAQDAGATVDGSDLKAPYAVPTLTVTALFHAASAFYTYAQYTQTGQTAFLLGTSGYGGLAALGLWCALFGTSGGRISKRTGADKRTSGFPFRNAEADRKKGKKRS